ncbi:carbamate kinase [Caldithrix abyssi]|uniref:Carbamate kinase n=1 Tax=Caldithrix abyssi DSM 13497 TaxID=880073 RepID=H1XSB1_CALAY|nr:carbamate kinase [Caldithrix abyssi]APF20217.1 carbamate kinase [Caldithrix abyssi DSM 13497]EHO40275.1 aspartate/glutamate/uridylate kinase [Caldithrix abyssi DSM 13497]
MKKRPIVVALGGNAITREFEEGNIPQQFENTRRSLEHIIGLLKEGFNMVITHGNGPQVGNALIRVEESRHLVPPLPLGIIVADLEGGMGYMIEQCLQNKMHDMGVKRQVATLVTQVLVDKDDPSIKNPSKFVGPFFKKEQVPELVEKRGWIMKEDKGRGYRRVVASPKPIGIVEKDIIKHLVDMGVVVIAAGGGGIPVYIDHSKHPGWLEGLDGVIDKDLASAVLGREIDAEKLLIITGVEKVALNFGTPEQIDLDELTIADARKYLAEGQFPKGSMGPKIEAAINFIEGGGEEVIITSIEKTGDAIKGKAGTRIHA